MVRQKYGSCLRYIDHFWREIIHKTPKDDGLLIGLPNPYVSPSNGEFENKMYYWDSYFINIGLLASGRVKLAKGIVDNLRHEFQRFRTIPQSNRFYHLAKSNPPFLSSMVREVFERTGDRKWLRAAAKDVQGEYEVRWTAGYKLTKTGLSRYWDPTHYHEQAEDESGWDRTSRFLDRCLDINPVDLNALLFRYEKDLEWVHRTLGDRRSVARWAGRAARRRRLIDRYLWDAKRGFYFDYDFVKRKRTNVWSLAGFFPLWAGAANSKQAEALRGKLRKFEHAGGLAATDRRYRKGSRQWDFPNGWPNLHWVVIKGLLDAGFRADAERVARKWLDTCALVFRKTGRFWEKYDVVRRAAGRTERYPAQWGFGWTNGVFVRLVKELDSRETF